MRANLVRTLSILYAARTLRASIKEDREPLANVQHAWRRRRRRRSTLAETRAADERAKSRLKCDGELNDNGRRAATFKLLTPRRARFRLPRASCARHRRPSSARSLASALSTTPDSRRADASTCRSDEQAAASIATENCKLSSLAAHRRRRPRAFYVRSSKLDDARNRKSERRCRNRREQLEAETIRLQR